MKARQTIKSLLFATLALGAMALQSASASSVTYGFGRISSNSTENVASQLQMVVSSVGTTGALFKFSNNIGIASSITDIYFDDIVAPGNLFSLISHSANSGSGVSFDSLAKPGELPGGNVVAFTTDFSGDSMKPTSPNGVNAADEWVSFLGTFASGKDFNGLVAALGDRSFRVGLHVQSIGIDGNSDSFVNTVPLPAAAWLFGSALFGFMMVSNRRKV